MSSNELTVPISATGVALPAAADTPVISFTMPGSTRSDVSLASFQFSPQGAFSVIGTIVVMRGILVVTAGATAGTITIKCFRNGTAQVDPNISQPITLAANEVKVIPFEFTDGYNPEFQQKWFYTITANPSAAAATANKAYGHSWGA